MPSYSLCYHNAHLYGAVGNSVINAFDTTLQRAARIALRQKTASLDRNTYEITDILPFRTLAQYKSHCRIKLLLFMANSELYLPSLITAPDSQHATHEASSYKFRLPGHNRSADKKFFYFAAAKLIIKQFTLATNICLPPASIYV